MHKIFIINDAKSKFCYDMDNYEKKDKFLRYSLFWNHKVGIFQRPDVGSMTSRNHVATSLKPVIF